VIRNTVDTLRARRRIIPITVYTDDIDGERMIMATVSAPDSFGESLAYLGVPNSPVYIVAEEDSAVWWFYPDALHRTDAIAAEAARLAERFTALLAERALAMNDRIQILSKKTLRLRLLAYFTFCRRRFGSATFAIPMNRERLAVYLGVNRSALSRELSQMQKEGLISYYRETFRLHYEKDIENNS
jgi:CRP-like cAMP-binding protein